MIPGILTIVYIFCVLLLFAGWRRQTQRFQFDADIHIIPKPISVVIACKNESNRISALLKSLQLLQYPEDNYEVIFVDDQSDDDTMEILRKFCSNAGFQCSVISSTGKTLPGKKGALTLAVERAKFQFIAITDADCEVPPMWLYGFSTLFTENYDIVIGGAPFHQTMSFLNQLYAFEYYKNRMLSMGLASAGLPYTAAARNFGYSKECYKLVGGYGSTIDRLGGDDDLLLREAVKKGCRIGYLVSEKFDVYSNCPVTIKEYFTQRGRHVSTSHVYSLKIRSLLTLWHVLNYAATFCALVSPWYPEWLLTFTVKYLVEIFLYPDLKAKQNRLKNAIVFLSLPLAYEFLPPLNFLISLCRKKKW